MRGIAKKTTRKNEPAVWQVLVRENKKLKSHKFVCVTTYQPDIKSYPNHNPTTKQQTIG